MPKSPKAKAGGAGASEHAPPNLMLEVRLNVRVPSTERQYLVIVPGGGAVREIYPVIDRQHLKLFGEELSMTYFKNPFGSVVDADYMVQKVFADGDTVEAHTDKIAQSLESADPEPSSSTKRAAETVSTPAPKKKRKKDPNSPKRPPNAFIHYCKKRRADIAAQEGEPDVKGQALVRQFGEEWRTMSEADKQPYKALNDAALAEYEKEVEKYRASTGSAASADGSAAPPAAGAAVPASESAEVPKTTIKQLVKQMGLGLDERGDVKIAELLTRYNEANGAAKNQKWVVKQLDKLSKKSRKSDQMKTD